MSELLFCPSSWNLNILGIMNRNLRQLNHKLHPLFLTALKLESFLCFQITPTIQLSVTIRMRSLSNGTSSNLNPFSAAAQDYAWVRCDWPEVGRAQRRSDGVSNGSGGCCGNRTLCITHLSNPRILARTPWRKALPYIHSGALWLVKPF